MGIRINDYFNTAKTTFKDLPLFWDAVNSLAGAGKSKGKKDVLELDTNEQRKTLIKGHKKKGMLAGLNSNGEKTYIQLNDEGMEILVFGQNMKVVSLKFNTEGELIEQKVLGTWDEERDEGIEDSLLKVFDEFDQTNKDKVLAFAKSQLHVQNK